MKTKKNTNKLIEMLLNCFYYYLDFEIFCLFFVEFIDRWINKQLFFSFSRTFFTTLLAFTLAPEINVNKIEIFSFSFLTENSKSVQNVV